MKTEQTASSAPARPAATESRGMSPQDFNAVIEHCPYLYHWTSPENLERILAEGLVPWDESDVGHQWSSELASRPGHVYMMGPTPSWDESEDWENPWTYETGYQGVYPSDGTVPVRIEVAKLKPQALVADEDHAGAVSFGHDDVSDPFSYNSLGEWAEKEAPFVDSSELAWSSLEQLNSLAHRGPIPSEALSVDPDWDYRSSAEDLKYG